MTEPADNTPDARVERWARAIFDAWAKHQNVDYTFDEIKRGTAIEDRFPALHETYDLAMLEARAAIAIADAELAVLRSFYNRAVTQKNKEHQRELQQLRANMLEDRL